jgi:predicted  nucleic acid-binding Zn-ribbon protein
MKEPRSYRLEKDVIQAIERLSDRRKRSHAGLLEELVRAAASADEQAELRAEVDALKEQVAELRAELADLRARLDAPEAGEGNR